MDTFDNHPLTTLIKRMSHKTSCTFEQLKKELLKKNNYSIPYHRLSVKENNDLAIIYYDKLCLKGKYREFKNPSKLENYTKSCILDKRTLKIIATQFNKVIYNDEAIKLLKMNNFDNIVVDVCHEGTMILVYYHNNKWYVSTRRCLDANDSKWIKDRSYRQMFNETIDNLFTLDDLDKNNVYYFILIHYKNKNIIDNSQMGDNYKSVIHIMTTNKYSPCEINYTINNNVPKLKNISFNSLDEVILKLKLISQQDEKNKHVSTEGFIIKIYKNSQKKGIFTVVKLQTALYRRLMKIKPNNNNIHQIYLELYQKNTLCDFLPYFTIYTTDVIKRINSTMKTISQEILNIYHATRNKKNQNLYNNLKEQYKKILYGLHKQYIKNREKDFQNGIEMSFSERKSKPISVHDVYHHLKRLEPYKLRKIFLERKLMIKENIASEFIKNNCMNTKIQTSLMFKD